MTYEYNKLGQKTRVLYQSGSTLMDVRYIYYANGWLKRVRNNTDPISKYTYDAVGNRTRADMGNGTYTAYGYDTDPRYRVSSIVHNVTGTPSSYTISYPLRDGAGNPQQMVDFNGTTDYNYDVYSRLYNSGQYVYDWVGNRLNPPADPNAMVYNSADQLTRWPGQHQYEYLQTGSLQYQYDDATPRNLQKTFAYTYANLLSTVIHAGVANPSTMTWDGAGNRITFASSTNAGNPYTFVYDTTAGIPAVIEEIIPAGGVGGGGSVYYIREPSGQLIARLAGIAIQYYHFGTLGSTRLLTNAAGAVTDKYSYDAWGNTTHDLGSTEQPYQYVGQLGYYTHYQDANLSLLQLGFRLYDPQTGRFTQVDRIRRSYGYYSYGDEQPTVGVDPSGLVCTLVLSLPWGGKDRLLIDTRTGSKPYDAHFWASVENGGEKEGDKWIQPAFFVITCHAQLLYKTWETWREWQNYRSWYLCFDGCNVWNETRLEAGPSHDYTKRGKDKVYDAEWTAMLGIWELVGNPPDFMPQANSAVFAAICRRNEPKAPKGPPR